MKIMSFGQISAIALGAVIAFSAPVMADHKSDLAKEETHDHDHDHDHSHEHADEAKKTAAQGHFEDADVADRPLTDWVGDWISVYPYLIDGTLDPVMAHKAESGEKTAQEYRAYYETGYKTDVDRIVIGEDSVAFYTGDNKVSGTYVSDGYEILTYESGSRGVRFVFRKTEGDDEAPDFIQFSDHIISPQKSDHFHLYWGDDREALFSELTNWPTYYPSDLNADQIVAAMLAH